LRTYRDIFIHVPKNGAKWSDDTDNAPRHFISQFGKQWSDIVSHIPDRTAIQIAGNWKKCINAKLMKGFPTEQDSLIKTFFQEPDRCVAEDHIRASRSSAQARPRALVQSPRTSAVKFSEDGVIVDAYFQSGRKWSATAQAITGWTGDAIKNKWNASISQPTRVAQQGNPKRNAGHATEKAQPSFTGSPKMWAIGDANETMKIRRDQKWPVFVAFVLGSVTSDNCLII
jgi:hypothetical protein